MKFVGVFLSIFVRDFAASIHKSFDIVTLDISQNILMQHDLYLISMISGIL